MNCPICQGRGKVFEDNDVDLCIYCGGSGLAEVATWLQVDSRFIELKAIIELRKSNPTMLAILENMA